jgi:hypothetical protein
VPAPRLLQPGSKPLVLRARNPNQTQSRST